MIAIHPWLLVAGCASPDPLTVVSKINKTKQINVGSDANTPREEKEREQHNLKKDRRTGQWREQKSGEASEERSAHDPIVEPHP